MSQGTCVLCFSITRVLDIKYTHLQYVYEELSDSEIQADSHPLCYICCAKLHQCEQLLKHIQECRCANQPEDRPLVRLGTFNTDNWSLSNNYIEIELQPIIKEEYINEEYVKSNPDHCADRTEIEIEYIKEEHVENNVGHRKDETAVLVEDQHTPTELRTTPDDGKFHTCDVCNKKFSYPSALKRHELTHSGIKQYACDTCNIHEEAVQSNPDDCADETDIKTEYIKEEHVENSPGHCEDETAVEPVEDKRTPIDLRTTDDLGKPHTCDVCSKKFPFASYLKRHKVIHTGVKPYSCDVCSKTFTRNTSLKTHKQIHNGRKLYSCDVCSKTFTQASNLKTHKLIHTGDKPYSCDVCSKTFTQAISLKTHKLMIHSGEKPYSCDVCNKTFTRTNDLKKHKIWGHGSAPAKTS